MDILDRIKLAYYEVNIMLINNYQYKMIHKDLRKFIYNSMMDKLGNIVDEIICNETNNPPEIIDDNLIMCSVKYINDINSIHNYTYIDLPFGKLIII